MKVFEQDGIKYREEELPPDFVVVDEYRPDRSIVPYDYYGNSHQAEILRVLALWDIQGKKQNTKEERIYPLGSGPGGRVRLGDSMLPGVYRIAVPESDAVKAIEVLQLPRHRCELRRADGGWKPQLQVQLQMVFGLSDDCFGYWASDLYVVRSPEVEAFLKKYLRFPQNLEHFRSPEGSGWVGAGKACLCIPFHGQWPKSLNGKEAPPWAI